MKCPVDDTTLVMTERTGVEIDYCPQCRGVWLDRGELDRIIEKSGSYEPPRHEYGGMPEEHAKHTKDHSFKKERRGSFIEDIFGGFGSD